MFPRLHPLALAIVLASPLFVSPAHAAGADAVATADAAADTPSKTPRGTTFLLPGGWSQKVQGNAVFVMTPENDGSRVVIVDAKAATPDEAVLEAWKLVGMTPKLVIATDAAPKDGWDARRYYDYDVAANAKRSIGASAYRKGTAWTVVLVDVDQGIAEKRSSQFGKLSQRLQPAGYSRETFAGRTAHKLDAARLQQLSTFIEQMR